MATLTVSLPDDLLNAARRKLLADRDTRSVEEFVLSALHGLADEDVPLDQALEAKALEALDSPLLDGHTIDWDAKLVAVNARRAGRQ